MIAPEELSRIWEQYASRLVLVARAIGEPAEDAVQEAFLRLAEQSVLPQEPMAWLVRVVRNQLLQWQRSSVRRRHRDQRVAQSRVWFQTQSPSEQLEADELTQALTVLPDIQRQIVVLHLWGELSFEEIASIVGLPRSTAHRRYLEAIDGLRTKLSNVKKPGDV